MDPTANLADQLRIAARLVEADGDGARLAELVLALHSWLSRCGMPPQQWRPGLNAYSSGAEFDASVDEAMAQELGRYSCTTCGHHKCSCLALEGSNY